MNRLERQDYKEAFKKAKMFEHNEYNEKLFGFHLKKMAYKMEEFLQKEVVDWKIFVNGLGRVQK